MRAKRVPGEPIRLDLAAQVGSYEGRLGQRSQPLFVLSNRLDVADGWIVPQQSICLLPHLFRHGLAGR